MATDFGFWCHRTPNRRPERRLENRDPLWDWAKEHADERINWIWEQLAYAERDGLVWSFLRHPISWANTNF